MAVISRRPRLTLCMSMFLMAAACSLVKPIETPADKQAAAATLVGAGKHAEAADVYAELAATSPADHDNYELLSAEQWVAAGNVAAAKQALAAVSPDARTTLPASRALVAAEIALAENDGVRATHELDSIVAPTAPDLAQNYWYLRGEAAFLTAHPVDGTKAFVERERYLTAANSLRASRDELLNKIRAAAERGQLTKPPANADPIVAGWLALGPVEAQLQRNPLHATGALDGWQRRYPGHPADESVLNASIGQPATPPGQFGAAVAPDQTAAAAAYPDQIALLLPLSGRSESVGVAVRDGFIAGYLQQDPAARPRVTIYDVAADGAAAAYQHAIQEGASFVVGPLFREDVAAVAPLAGGRTPVLALNFLADTAAAPHDFYQFALLPEDEARIVARRLVADGKLAGVAILPSGELGSRVGAAFSNELTQLGGTLLDTGRYESGRPDFTDIIKQTLQIHGVKGEPATHRSDATFVFVAGTPAASRLIVSQLKFHFAGDIPVYATSDSFEPEASANNDLDGLSFPDMPWMVSADPAISQIRDAVRSAWPTQTARRDRLYAFGFDAYRLVPALRDGALPGGADIAGVTGKLHLDDHNRIRRDLDWAQIRGGAATPLQVNDAL